MQAYAMGDKTDGLEPQFTELFEELLINLFAAGAGLDHVHHEILACDQIRPDLLLLGRRLADHGCAANAGQINVFLTEDLHTDQIPCPEFSLLRPAVWKLAALT